MRRVTPCLWFDSSAEEAAQFYTSIFPNSRISATTHYDEAGSKASGRPVGSVMTVAFLLDGNPFVGLNGGPVFTFTEAISFMITCEAQQEVDHYWEQLVSGGGTHVQCGWLKDRFGVSWQVVPAVLEQLLADPDPEKARRVMAAMLKMTKLDVAELVRAGEGRAT